MQSRMYIIVYNRRMQRCVATECLRRIENNILPSSLHRPCSKISRDLLAWILSWDELVVRLNTNGFICKEKNSERERGGGGGNKQRAKPHYYSSLSLPRLPSPSSFPNQNPTLTQHSSTNGLKRYPKFNRWSLWKWNCGRWRIIISIQSSQPIVRFSGFSF